MGELPCTQAGSCHSELDCKLTTEFLSSIYISSVGQFIPRLQRVAPRHQIYTVHCTLAAAAERVRERSRMSHSSA